MGDRPDRVYYELSLSSGQLTAALATVAALIVAAFVLGYAAAWTVRQRPAAPAAAPSPAMEPSPAPAPSPTATPQPPPSPTASPEVTPTPATPAVSRLATPTAAPTATATPRPTPTPTAAPAPSGGYWVQVLASREPRAVREQQRRLEELGFPASHQRVVRVRTADGNLLLKLRVGPFPDAASAERVKRRMRAAGYDDAWVVRP